MKKLFWYLMFWAFGFVLFSEANAQELDSAHLQQLKFRHIGPVGNRIISVTGIPDNPLIYYVGAASGGVWKTVDGGLNWKPVFDKQPVHSIGALALAPSHPETVYAGTGESFIRSNISIGNGVWKTTDGGENWTHLGLEETGRISRVIVDPANENIVFVAALGHAYTPQEQRGIFKTTDGGKTWKHVLKVDEHTGASDLVMDPHNNHILFAGMWQLEIRPWIRTSGGPGSGIFRSLDGGETWEKLKDNGLPKGNVGKIALAMTAAQPQRIYALIETGDGIPLHGEPTNSGELWRSDDRGKSFRLVNSNRDLSGRGAYYTRCAASPDNPNEIYFMAAGYATSIDGGLTTTNAIPGTDPNWDHHEMWIDPLNGNRQVVVGDGGVSISQNRGKSWLRITLPVAQLYHVTTDKAIPYNVLTNRQDGPSMKGPSRSRGESFFGNFIASGLWHDVGGGESGFATADPNDPDVIWSSASGFGALGGVVVKYNQKNKQFRQVEVWPELTAGSAAEEVKYRFQWTFPLLISPHDSKTVYVASQYVHRTQNGGQSWEIISPDLTFNDKSKQKFSGGLTGDNIGVEYANVVYALDESPKKSGLIWAGTNDGQVHITQNHGQNWTNVTSRIPGIPTYGAVRNIEASMHQEGTAYLTVDAHEMGDFMPYVYKTTNYGQSWKKITNGISAGKLSYCRMIKEDPFRPGLLYLGTENALYVSFNDGEKWLSFMSNLPASPMYWMDIPEHFNDLVVGTYGRGIWILDDLTPIQQYTREVEKSTVHLFAPKAAYRFHPISSVMQFFPEASSGQDPPAGASLHYWLAPGQDTLLKDSLTLLITNQAGDTIRNIKHKGKAGFNRVWWDLKRNPTTKILMRTEPRYAKWVRLDDNRTRKALPQPLSILVLPGKYQVQLIADSTVRGMQEIELLKDPNSDGTMQDINLQTDLLERIRMSYDEISTEVNRIEIIRRQMLDLLPMLPSGNETLIRQIDRVDSLIVEVENQMIQLQHTGTGQDVIRKPGKLLEKLGYLSMAVAVSDFRPADQHEEVFKVLSDRWREVRSQWNQLQSVTLSDLLKELKARDLGGVILP